MSLWFGWSRTFANDYILARL